MYSYRVVFEEVDDARRLKNLLEEIGDTYASVNARKNEAVIETDESISEICEMLKDEGYEIIELEMTDSEKEALAHSAEVLRKHTMLADQITAGLK